MQKKYKHHSDTNGVFEKTHRYISEEILDTESFRNKMEEFIGCVTGNVFVALRRNHMCLFVFLSEIYKKGFEAKEYRNIQRSKPSSPPPNQECPVYPFSGQFQTSKQSKPTTARKCKSGISMYNNTPNLHNTLDQTETSTHNAPPKSVRKRGQT